LPRDWRNFGAPPAATRSLFSHLETRAQRQDHFAASLQSMRGRSLAMRRMDEASGTLF